MSGLESGFEGAGQSRHPEGPVPGEETQPMSPGEAAWPQERSRAFLESSLDTHYRRGPG